MTQGILNPVKLPSDLTPAEKEFARCLAGGISCKVGSGNLPEKPVESGGAANVVRSEIIRFFAHGGNEENPVQVSVIDLQGAWISGNESLRLAHASIPYALAFGYCRFAVPVDMAHAECGALYLDGSCLEHGLVANGLKTKGNAQLRNGFFAKGGVRLWGANIGGDLDCASGKFSSPGEYALAADGITTKGGVFLRKGFSAEGEVRLPGASIGGNLDCTNGEFCNLNGCALAADGITVGGSAFLRSDFFADGEVRLMDANIGGNLECNGGGFHNPNGRALSADRIRTGSGVYMRALESDAEEGESSSFFANGRVSFPNAKIGGEWDCSGGVFSNPAGRALAARDAEIKGPLLWRKMAGCGIVALEGAKISALMDDSDSWELFEVILDGFTYDRFADHADAKSRIKWLANRPDDTPFSPQPYEQAAKVLFGMGRPVDAWDILREKRRLERVRDKSSWLRRAGGKMVDTLTDFVFRPLRTVKWAAGFVLAGAVVFGAADHFGRMVPHQPIVLAKAEYQDARRAGRHPFRAARAAVPDYPGFNPLAFSLDVFVPLFNLHQEPYWAPDPGGNDFVRRLTRGAGKFDWWWALTAWYWIEIAAGWLLSSLLLLSVTGLLRPRIGGGD